jgi:hypothetical protein
MKLRPCHLLAFAIALGAIPASAAPPDVRVSKIWDAAPHSAFTDLIRFRDEWFCAFRESAAHVGGDGILRVLVSSDGDAWTSAAAIAESGVDLRDPKLSITPDGRLMLVAGGSIYNGTATLKGRQPRVAFSADGRAWSPTRRILAEGDWLWRVTWHDGVAYGTSYKAPDEASPEGELILYRSPDGERWEKLTKLDIPAAPNETTLRFDADGACLALVRREGSKVNPTRTGMLGRSRPPYREWTWQDLHHFIGGPNLIRLPDGSWWAAGRIVDRPGGPRTALGPITKDGWSPDIVLPSGGDTSYPGMAWHEGTLWLSYYSSHEGNAAMYLAKIRGLER